MLAKMFACKVVVEKHGANSSAVQYVWQYKIVLQAVTKESKELVRVE